jgi:hypothetical protein
MRPLDVVVQFFPKLRIKKYFRADKPKVFVKEAPMEPSDFHLDLELNPPPAPKKKEEEAKAKEPKAESTEPPLTKDGTLGQPVIPEK